MRLHFPQVAVITDMISNPILIGIRVLLLATTQALNEFKSFEDRAGILFATTEVVHFATARIQIEFIHKSRDVLRMDIVADLFAFVTEDGVLPPLKIALHEVTEKTVQLDPG